MIFIVFLIAYISETLLDLKKPVDFTSVVDTNPEDS